MHVIIPFPIVAICIYGNGRNEYTAAFIKGIFANCFSMQKFLSELQLVLQDSESQLQKWYNKPSL